MTRAVADNITLSLPAHGARVWMRTLAELGKARITAMVALTAAAGFELARPHATPMPWALLLAAAAGTSLCCAGASAFNQVLERDMDARMQRTRNRPLPAGRISAGAATLLAALSALAGLAALAAFTTPLACVLAAATLASYVLVYTPLKRVTHLATIVGAVPGAAPPLIGCAAASGELTPPAMVLFAVMFIWQLPHSLAITWLYRDDFRKAGLPLLAVVDPGGESTFRQILVSATVLLPVSLLPSVIGLTGTIYFVTAALAGGVLLALALALLLRRGTKHTRSLFIATLVYLPLVTAAMLLDRL